MKHLFSSGEVMYKKNQKELPEGLLSGETLEYDSVEEGSFFLCAGSLEGRPVKVRFSLSEDEFEDVRNRYMFRILMQSDILLAKWKAYEILDLE